MQKIGFSFAIIWITLFTHPSHAAEEYSQGPLKIQSVLYAGVDITEYLKFNPGILINWIPAKGTSNTYMYLLMPFKPMKDAPFWIAPGVGWANGLPKNSDSVLLTVQSWGKIIPDLSYFADVEYYRQVQTGEHHIYSTQQIEYRPWSQYPFGIMVQGRVFDTAVSISPGVSLPIPFLKGTRIVFQYTFGVYNNPSHNPLIGLTSIY